MHGGHYYAHIRPTRSCDANETNFWSHITQNALNGYDNCDLNVLSKEGNWFQFDDENVYLVDKRSAVDGNYGSRCDVHSAYMLVYLRESDAESLMNYVDDLPEELLQKIQDVDEEERHLRRHYNSHFSSTSYGYGLDGTGYGYNDDRGGGTRYGLSNRTHIWDDTRGGDILGSDKFMNF